MQHLESEKVATSNARPFYMHAELHCGGVTCCVYSRRGGGACNAFDLSAWLHCGGVTQLQCYASTRVEHNIGRVAWPHVGCNEWAGGTNTQTYIFNSMIFKSHPFCTKFLLRLDPRSISLQHPSLPSVLAAVQPSRWKATYRTLWMLNHLLDFPIETCKHGFTPVDIIKSWTRCCSEGSWKFLQHHYGEKW